MHRLMQRRSTWRWTRLPCERWSQPAAARRDRGHRRPGRAGDGCRVAVQPFTRSGRPCPAAPDGPRRLRSAVLVRATGPAGRTHPRRHRLLGPDARRTGNRDRVQDRRPASGARNTGRRVCRALATVLGVTEVDVRIVCPQEPFRPCKTCESAVFTLLTHEKSGFFSKSSGGLRYALDGPAVIGRSERQFWR